jgi:hypothetical protein
MAILVHQCPHPLCLTENISLTVLAATALDTFSGTVHLDCPRCRMPSAALIEKRNKGQGYQFGQVVGQPANITDLDYIIKEFWPAAPKPLIPELLPPDIVRVYLQAERNFPVAGNEEASGTMYRKALDVALKKIDASLTGTLGQKIKALAKAGKLTDDIAVWSDNVRDIGNDAAHEENPITRDELIALRNFSEMVLRYLFSLPNAVKKRRGEKLDWETEANPTSS